LKSLLDDIQIIRRTKVNFVISETSQYLRKLPVDERRLNNMQEVKIDERIVFSRHGGCRVHHLPDKETFWILRITREFNHYQ